MKSLIKFLSNPLISLISAILLIYIMLHSYKFCITYWLMAIPATGLIWMMNYDYLKMQKNKHNIEITKSMYLCMFLFDVISWPLSLISTSRIILDEDV